MPVADYAAQTQVESTWGDAFTAEITDLRVAERLPSVAGTFDTHVLPLPVSGSGGPGPSKPPSTIIDVTRGVFFLGVDLGFVGTSLFGPGTPSAVSATVQFFLEGYGTTPRLEINIAPQIFPLLVSPGHDRHQLWVQVDKGHLPGIIEAPTGLSWDELFLSDTVYKIAAHVKITPTDFFPIVGDLTGFIEGLAISTGAAA